MAAPLTHLILFDRLYNWSDLFDKNRFVSYVLWTSFPDIRYLWVIERNKTHLPVDSRAEVLTWDPFFVGMKLHQWIDIKREEFLHSQWLYDVCPESKYLTQVVKFFEDRYLYDKFINKAVYHDAFQLYDDWEFQFGIQYQDLRLWHAALQGYIMSGGPTYEGVVNYVKALGSPVILADEIRNMSSRVMDLPEASIYADSLYNNIFDILETQNCE